MHPPLSSMAILRLLPMAIKFYAGGEPNEPDTLFQIPTLGGVPRKIVDNVGSFAVSPDANQVAFTRSRTSLLLINSNGSSERILAKLPDGQIRSFIAWRPDGATLMTSVVIGDKNYLSEVSLSYGSETRVPTPPWRIVTGIKWLSDASSFLITGRDFDVQFLRFGRFRIRAEPSIE